MASGFIQRWKGKATFDPAAFWVGGVPLYGPASAQTVGNVAAQSTVSIFGYGVTNIAASTQQVFARLPAPPFAGIDKTIQAVAGTTGFFVTLPAGVTFNGTTMNTIKSTVNGVVTLVGQSSVNWAVTGYASTGTLTYSTST